MTIRTSTFSKKRPKLTWKSYAAAYGAVSTCHLGALLGGHDKTSDTTQVLLMLFLALAVLSATKSPRSRFIKLLLLSLLFSWLGDTLPRFMEGDNGFLTMVVFFLLAQVVFIIALLPRHEDSILTKPQLLVPYLVFFAVLVAVCAPNAGNLLVPVIIYGLALMTMAVLSTGLGKLGGLGGAIFFLSDGLIALRAFSSVQLPGHGFWVMLTYIVAQALLAVAFITAPASARVTARVTAPVTA